MSRGALLRRFAMVGLVAALACSHDTGDADGSILHDARFRALVVEMNLPEHAEQRLEMYVATLDASRAMAWQAEPATEEVILGAMDTEIGRALPLLVPAIYVGKLRAILHDAMRPR